jgi:hypothetical protein
VDNSDVLLSDVFGILETESQNTLGGFPGDQLDRLNYPVHHLVLDSRVFSLGILANKNGVNVVIEGLVARDRAARTDVGEEVESSTEGQIEGNMSLSDGSLGYSQQHSSALWVGRTTYGKRSFQSHIVLLDGRNSIIRNGGLTVL